MRTQPWAHLVTSTTRREWGGVRPSSAAATFDNPSVSFLLAGRHTFNAAAAEDGHTARISLRLPEALKTAVEAAAAREGVSVNTWIVRALTRSTTSGTTVQSGNRLQGWARS